MACTTQYCLWHPPPTHVRKCTRPSPLYRTASDENLDVGLGTRLQLTINPLTTEFFPPRQHIFMHSVHTTFVGTPLPQHLLLSGQTWWGPHTWRDPFGNTVNDIHDPHKPSNRRSKVDVSRIFAQHFPKLGPDLTDGTPYTTNVFLRPWVGSMNIIRIKNSRVNESH